MITVEINDRAIRQAFAALESALTDMSRAMDEIGNVLVFSTTERMRQGISPDGSPFAPRSPATLKAYERHGKKPGPHPLYLDGDMRENRTSHSYGPNYVEVSSSAIQAAVMHLVPHRAPSVCVRDKTSSGDGMSTASLGATSRRALSSGSRIRTGRTSPRSSANGWRTRSTAPDNRPSGHLATPDDR